MAKQNKGAIRYIFCWSVNWWFGLLWRSDVACVRAASQMMSHLQNLLCDV